MLTSLFIFSLKASVVLGVLYLAYHLLFKKNTRFVVKRMLLISIILATCALPLVQFNTESEVLPSTPSIQRVDALTTGSQKTIDVPPLKKETPGTYENGFYQRRTFNTRLEKGKLTVIDIATLIYAAGLGITLLLLVLSLAKIISLGVFGSARHDLDRNIITHRWIKYPFSFGRWIFIPKGTTYDEHTWELIHTHEQAHLKQLHTVDVVISSVLRCLFWYNPVIYLLQKEIKNNHESLADEASLKEVNLDSYTQALIAVSLDAGSFNLGHGFALKSGLAERIKNMQRHKTAILKSTMALLVFAIVGFGVFTQTSLYSQQLKSTRPTRKDVMNGALNIPFLSFKLAPRHERVLEKLHTLFPDKDLRWQYMKEGRPEVYNDLYYDYRKTEYFSKVTKDDKEALKELITADTSRHQFLMILYDLEKSDLMTMIDTKVESDMNYLVIYEPLFPKEDGVSNKVYEMDEVDVLPEPIGGLEALQRAIALDMQLPENIDKADLPKTIDFSFVVYGGTRISDLNLETELKGSDRKNAHIYRFFGSIHNDLMGKIRSYYGWEKGSINGRKVNVRMVVSIPTKYM